eukprot:TRINITY_DN820_c0_g1_i8.p1 TRINITY_DN820_c0_g1~~TRINITY_DN820_c0_g1_i8.p1  ORF type:complete len:690 (-),score=186.94 TRINITY_DN820_c0_g1_i8:58-2127(-)
MHKGIFLIPCLLATVQAANWNSNNCGFGSHAAVTGNVTDAICAHYTDCSDINSRNYGSLLSKSQACDALAVCLWNSETNECGMNRDSKNNVCVPANDDGTPAEIKQTCHDITRGICPRNWQVRRGCCTGDAAKYDGILQVDNNFWICCNLPCESLANHTDTEPNLCRYEDHVHLEQCGPAGRSFFGPGAGGMKGMGGYKDMQLGPKTVQSMFGMDPGRQMSFGIANEGFGYTGMTPQMGINALEEVGVGHSKEHHTEEITVDDLMDVLIESLSKDKDVFDYSREINSDPWFQKQAFGGHVDKFSFIDPWKFISQIYGTPFGMSQASTTYGNMYGIDPSKFKKPAKGFENVGKIVHQNMMKGGYKGGHGYRGGPGYGGGPGFGGQGYSGGQGGYSGGQGGYMGGQGGYMGGQMGGQGGYMSGQMGGQSGYMGGQGGHGGYPGSQQSRGYMGQGMDSQYNPSGHSNSWQQDNSMNSWQNNQQDMMGGGMTGGMMGGMAGGTSGSMGGDNMAGGMGGMAGGMGGMAGGMAGIGGMGGMGGMAGGLAGGMPGGMGGMPGGMGGMPGGMGGMPGGMGGMPGGMGGVPAGMGGVGGAMGEVSQGLGTAGWTSQELYPQPGQINAQGGGQTGQGFDWSGSQGGGFGGQMGFDQSSSGQSQGGLGGMLSMDPNTADGGYPLDPMILGGGELSKEYQK